MRTMKYKGYQGSIEYSKEDNCFFGKVLGLVEDCITYEGDNKDTLAEDFHGAVDMYLESCKERGVQPRKPYSGTVSFHLSPDDHSRIAANARKAGISVSRYIRQALALL